MVDYFRTVETSTSYLHDRKYLPISNNIIFFRLTLKSYHIVYKYLDKNTFYVLIIFVRLGNDGNAPADPGPMGQTI